METTLIRMSPTGFKAFVEVLSHPARPVPEMVELFQRAAPWEKEQKPRSKLKLFRTANAPLSTHP